jgi:hypothetical protein
VASRELIVFVSCPPALFERLRRQAAVPATVTTKNRSSSWSATRSFALHLGLSRCQTRGESDPSDAGNNYLSSHGFLQMCQWTGR